MPEQDQRGHGSGVDRLVGADLALLEVLDDVAEDVLLEVRSRLVLLVARLVGVLLVQEEGARILGDTWAW